MLKLNFTRCSTSDLKTDLLVLPCSKQEILASRAKSKRAAKAGPLITLKTLDKQLNGALAAHLKRIQFEGGDGESALVNLNANGDIRNVLVIGWSDRGKDRFDSIGAYRKLGNALFENARSVRAKHVTLTPLALELSDDENAAALLEGIYLADYVFERYKTEKKTPVKAFEELHIPGARRFSEKLAKEAAVVCEATSMARDLINMPPNDCSPTFLARKAREVARRSRLAIQVFDRERLKRMGANALLAVNKGSSEPPFLIKLTYKPSGRSSRVVTIVGKGVTFDSGGLSIKTASGMETMKCDMSGAAAVLAAMQAIAALKPRTEVRAYIPITENMINGIATRPGDVVKAMNGKTVEILNTDAEGRLILADALSLAVKEKSQLIVDLATLTGACMVALGNEYAGLFCNDEKLAERLNYCAEGAGERLWRMPLAREYRELIKSSVADIKNTGGSYGGAITAALFLKEFVGDTKWAHLDIAGPAFADGAKGYIKKGGVGFGVRTLVRFLMERY